MAVLQKRKVGAKASGESSVGGGKSSFLPASIATNDCRHKLDKMASLSTEGCVPGRVPVMSMASVEGSAKSSKTSWIGNGNPSKATLPYRFWERAFAYRGNSSRVRRLFLSSASPGTSYRLYARKHFGMSTTIVNASSKPKIVSAHSEFKNDCCDGDATVVGDAPVMGSSIPSTREL